MGTKKNLIKVMIYIVVFIIIDNLIGYVMISPHLVGYMQARCMLNELTKCESIDVVFCGNSNIYSALDPFYFERCMDEEYTCLDCATSNATPKEMFFELKYLFRSHKPKYVILDIPYYMIQNNVHFESYERSVYLFDNLKDYRLKLEYIVSEPISNWPYILLKSSRVSNNMFCNIRQNLIDKLSDEYRNYLPLSLEKGCYVGKGYRVLEDCNENGTIGIDPYLSFSRSALNEESLKYIKLIKKLCDQNNSELILIAAPNNISSKIAMNNYQEVYEYMTFLAQEMGVSYIDFNIAKGEFLSIGDSGFYDQHHMTESGSKQFTEKMAFIFKKIVEKEDFNTYFYSSYDEWYDEYKQIAGVALIFENDNISAEVVGGNGLKPEYSFYERIDNQKWICIQNCKSNDYIKTDAYKDYKVEVYLDKKKQAQAVWKYAE